MSRFPGAGLCAGCAHGEVVASARSRFLRCARSDGDPRFSRYPPLPVVSCPGFEAGAPDDRPRGTAARGKRAR